MQTDVTPFGTTLAQLLMDSGYTRRNNNPDWVAFSATLDKVGYESLRKAVTGERPVSQEIMEQVAFALNVPPTTFIEYRLMAAIRELDPKQVGWKRAATALQSWESFKAASQTSADACTDEDFV